VRIGIDGCSWSNKRGFGRFTRELVGAMVTANRGAARQLSLVVDGHTCAEYEFPADLEIVEVATRQQPSKAASAAGQRGVGDILRLARVSAAQNFDAFFFPAVYSYFPLPAAVPTLVTLHDAIAERHPRLVFPSWRGRFAWKLKVATALRRSDRVLTVSQNAAEVIAATFSYPRESIDVVPEGPAPEFRVLDDQARCRALRDRFSIPATSALLLYVGGISPSKNLGGLVDAVAMMAAHEVPDWRLLLVGDLNADGFLSCGEELRSRVVAKGLGERVLFAGYLEAEDLVTAYNAADLLVLPSFDEGFGLPVIESLACGTPVAVSDRGSLPEVTGDAGVYFDPTDSTGMAEAMTRGLTDEALRRSMMAAAQEQLEQYSWARAAERVLDILDSLATGGSVLDG
jgi:glycosyltransferase involved in cell wall biosynthesis